MIAAIVAHAKHSSDVNIYQEGSFLRNPAIFMHNLDYSFDSFANKPWIDNNGNLVNVGKVSCNLRRMTSFDRYMKIRY